MLPRIADRRIHDRLDLLARHLLRRRKRARDRHFLAVETFGNSAADELPRDGEAREIAKAILLLAEERLVDPCLVCRASVGLDELQRVLGLPLCKAGTEGIEILPGAAARVRIFSCDARMSPAVLVLGGSR